MNLVQSDKMNYFILFSVLFITYCIHNTSAQRSKNYCLQSLCSYGKHIACGNNGTYSSYCTADSTLIDITPFKTLILGRHNQLRNRIAGGNMAGYKPAVRMPTLAWDEELAYLASLNVKRCLFEHDYCRNTDRFKNSGQNLAWKWDFPAPKPREIINWALDSWTNEHKDASMADIDMFHSSFNQIMSFTLMVSERNTKVGCAMLRQTDKGGIDMFFACNYVTTNIYNRPVYRSGPAGSQCIRGRNPSYLSLCSVVEPIEVNKV